MKKFNRYCKWLSTLTCLLTSMSAMTDVTVNQGSTNRINHMQGHYSVGDKMLNSGIVFFVDDTGVHGLVVKTDDEIGTMIWIDAVAAAEAVGSGWRFPTSAELLLLYTHRKEIGGFANEDYWSATEQDINSAWIQGFRTGEPGPLQQIQ